MPKEEQEERREMLAAQRLKEATLNGRMRLDNNEKEKESNDGVMEEDEVATATATTAVPKAVRT